MTAVKITPTKLKGKVQVPPSKSLAHRAIICASLAKGISRIDNIEYSKDIQATIKAMQSLGTKIEEYKDYLIIDGTSTFTKNNSEIHFMKFLSDKILATYIKKIFWIYM